ncbi:MAG TPA: winged helix-turn-helix domain-containing protein [Pyrinomonadaceae bacterium]|jgi:TolB-like protein/cytochrome c-type biogenesis protein CcmH/NrfG
MEKGRVIAYEFGPYRLLPGERLLLRRGETVALTPKVFDTLLVLVEHGGRLLAKERLMKMIWQDSFVEEGNLTQNIFILRKVLGESPHDHQYIVTIPGQGYRFVAAVREILPEAEAAFRYRDDDGPSTVTDARASGRALTSLAVLPFRSLHSEGDHAYLGPGIADTLITRLSNIKRLTVRPTTAILKYIDSQPDPLGAGRELGVDAVLDGRIQRAQERIRVTMQLIRVRDGKTLWAEKFDEKLTDIFEVQDSISEQVMRALAVQLTSDEQKLLTKRYTESVEAFQLYIKGRHFWNKRTVEDLRRGMACAQQAIDIDPTYTMAYIGLADTYNLLAGYGGVNPKETFPKARAAALRAQEIDPTLAEAEASLAFVAYRYEWNWTEAEERFRRSIELRPDYPTAHHWYGEYLAAVGLYSQSIAELERAQQLDPLSLPINTDLGQSLYFARRYAQAIEQLLKTLEMGHGFVRAHVLLGAAYEQQQMYTEAIAALSRARELSGENHLATGGLGYTLAVAGRRDEALETLRELERLAAQSYVSPYTIALIHVGLGQHERALDWLRKAYEQRDVWLVWLRVNPRFDALRADPRFAELLRRVNLAAS